jgi:Fe-S cluster assembly iron-binding protein IscA
MGEDDTVVEHGVVKIIMDSLSAPLLSVRKWTMGRPRGDQVL